MQRARARAAKQDARREALLRRRQRKREMRELKEGFTRQRRVIAACLVGIGLLILAAGLWSPRMPDAEQGSANLLLVFLAGLTAGGLSCLAVQGGLLATAVAQREDLDLAGPAHPQASPPAGNRRRGQAATRELRRRENAYKQAALQHNAAPLLWFLGAKIVTYTLLGALLGSLGGLIQPNASMRAAIQIFTGLFMVATALHFLRVHPIFRYVIIQPPRWLTRRITRRARSRDAFAPASLGAMTVFLPCGVTQAMEVLAINTGSPLTGATVMFVFTVATTPIFFLLGYFATRLGDLLQRRFLQLAAVVILLIALLTLDAGLRLAGSPVTVIGTAKALVAKPKPVPAVRAQDGVQEARISVNARGYKPSVVQIASGEPARVVFVSRGAAGCTLSLVFEDKQHVLPENGETPIELPAQEPRTIRYTCSMGMYGGTIEVTG